MKTYTYEEVHRASLDYFEGDALATDVFAGKYALQDLKGNIYELTPADMHRRLAKEFTRVEASYPNPMSEDEIYEMLADWQVVPQGGPMSAIGNKFQAQSLSNCFVIESPYDSYGGIMKSDQEQVQLMKRRGGVGFDISTIRPKGQPAANAARTTDGIGAFMERYSNTCREVAQGGRRGALMLTISCFVGSTLILTEDGWLTIKTMVEQGYVGRVWTHEGFKKIDAYQDLGERDVCEVECENGRRITVTADHKFVVRNVRTQEEYLKAIVDIDQETEELVFYDVQFEPASIASVGVISVTSVTKSTSKILKVKKASHEPVYDLTVRDVHRINANGFYTSNCHHPDVLTFANIKRDKSKVTGANVSVRMTNEFMQAVKDGAQYQQRFPVEKDAKHVIEQWVDAREVWKNIVAAMRDCSEPGMLFWDAIKERSPADAYEKQGYGTVSTNPCVTGDTLIAVADGRGYVPIKQLADEGKDVPVYCHQDDTGKMIVRRMRNPRLTGRSVPVFKVTIEGGHTFRATGNHTMIMRDGTRKRVDELVCDDQLMISKRVERTLVEMGVTVRSSNPNHYVMIENYHGARSEHRMIWEHHNGMVPKGCVIHHVNFDSRDNRIDNLRCMDYFEHRKLHAVHMRGKNNPIFKIKADPKRFAEYSAKMSKSVSGTNNPRAYDVTQEEFLDHVCALTNKLGRRITRAEWFLYAKAHGLPLWPNAWRSGGDGFYALMVDVAQRLGFGVHASADARTLRTLDQAVSQGYVADIVDRRVIVNRTCEWCSKEFTNRWDRREIAFCSRSCASFYANRKAGKNVARAASVQAAAAKKAEWSRKKQLDVFTQLRFELGRDPLGREWVTKCRELNVPARIGTKNGFTTWSDLKSCAAVYNHRVISVELCGNEDVYNGTVDEEHTICFGGWDLGNNEQLQIHSENCGEIPMSAYDACRLLLINLSKFVKDPFTSKARFDYAHYGSVVQKSQRMMDDLIDLELEAVDNIIAKIKRDPEPEEVKQVELELWLKIRNATVNGRRTGLGITALGDAFAYLGLAYGSDESITLTEKIYRALAFNSYRASVTMAKERGPFPIFSHDAERDHPFIQQIMAVDPKLRADYETYGRRNIANTTTAPAGSTSIETQTTSGCEPVLFEEAVRYRKINPSDKAATVDRVDDKGDKWQAYKVFHRGVQKWMEITGETDVTKSPYHGSTVEEIDWAKKIDVQAAAQKWICHSISNTHNLPKDVSVETVERLCWKAWETRCKGITVYRIGSRDAVIAKEQDVRGSPTEIVETHAPKRPKELPCDIHRASIQGENYLVLVGLFGGRPYEIFAGLQEHVEVPKKVKRGVLVKNGKNKDGVATYNLRIPFGDDDEMTFKDIVNLFDNPNHGALTRTVSLALRHGAPVQYLVEQLRKDKRSDFFSFSSVIARTFSKNYIPDGTSASSNERNCPVCGNETLVYQSGCVSCMGGTMPDGTHCSWSKCG